MKEEGKEGVPAGSRRRREDYLQSPTCLSGRSGQLELELGQSSEDGEDEERDVRRGRSVGSTGEEVAGRLPQVFCCRTRDEPGGLDLEGWRAWGRLAHLLLCQEWPVGSHGAPACGLPPKCHISSSNSIYCSLL